MLIYYLQLMKSCFLKFYASGPWLHIPEFCVFIPTTKWSPGFKTCTKLQVYLNLRSLVRTSIKLSVTILFFNLLYLGLSYLAGDWRTYPNYIFLQATDWYIRHTIIVINPKKPILKNRLAYSKCKTVANINFSWLGSID